MLWLARDRNFLPVKLVSRSDITATVTEFREIGPGVWLPAQASISQYNSALSKRLGRPAFGYELRYKLVEAKLHPNYPDSFFRDIPIPDGMTVYEVHGKKIVKSYIQRSETSKYGGRRWLWPVGLAGLGIGAVVALQYRRRDRPNG